MAIHCPEQPSQIHLLMKKLCNQHHTTNSMLLALNDGKQGWAGLVEVILSISALGWSSSSQVVPGSCGSILVLESFQDDDFDPRQFLLNSFQFSNSILLCCSVTHHSGPLPMGTERRLFPIAAMSYIPED